MSTEIKLSKAQVSKIIQIGGFRIIIKWISRSINKRCSSFDKKYFSTLRITAAGLNKEMHDFMKIVQALEDLIFFLKESLKQLKRKQKKKNEDS